MSSLTLNGHSRSFKSPDYDEKSAASSSDAALSTKTAGDFIVIQPSKDAWDTISRIQRDVGEQLKKIGITTWAPNPHHLAHLTLFMGLQAGLTADERTKLMTRVMRKLSDSEAFTQNIRFSHVDTKVKFGPFKYVTLHFASPKLQALQQKVMEAVKEAVEHDEVSVEKVHFEKIHKSFHPHFTLGILDVDSTEHEDVAKLNTGENKKQIGRFFGGKKKKDYKALSVSFLVKSITLLGVPDLKAKVRDKKYVTLIKRDLSSDAPRLEQRAKEETSALNRITAQIQSQLGYSSFFTLKPSSAFISKTSTYKPMIGVEFMNRKDAEKLLQHVDSRPGAKIQDADGSFLVNLGPERCEKLFKGKVGLDVYTEATAQLDSPKPQKRKRADEDTSISKRQRSSDTKSTDALNEKLQKLANYPEAFQIERFQHGAGSPVLRVKFWYQGDIEEFCEKHSLKIGTGRDIMGYVDLNQEACEKIFGKSEGQAIFKDFC